MDSERIYDTLSFYCGIIKTMNKKENVKTEQHTEIETPVILDKDWNEHIESMVKKVVEEATRKSKN